MVADLCCQLAGIVQLSWSSSVKFSVNRWLPPCCWCSLEEAEAEMKRKRDAAKRVNPRLAAAAKELGGTLHAFAAWL